MTGAAAILAHDVGKYVARIAKNVAPGAPVPEALLPLFVVDLYALPSGARASARFAELRGALEDPRLEEAAALLAEIDRLEAQVRAADPVATARACDAARRIEQLLRGVAGSGP